MITTKWLVALYGICSIPKFSNWTYEKVKIHFAHFKKLLKQLILGDMSGTEQSKLHWMRNPEGQIPSLAYGVISCNSAADARPCQNKKSPWADTETVPNWLSTVFLPHNPLFSQAALLACWCRLAPLSLQVSQDLISQTHKEWQLPHDLHLLAPEITYSLSTHSSCQIPNSQPADYSGPLPADFWELLCYIPCKADFDTLSEWVEISFQENITSLYQAKSSLHNEACSESGETACLYFTTCPTCNFTFWRQ